MKKSYLHLSREEFKNNFSRHFVHRKKIRALETFLTFADIDYYTYSSIASHLPYTKTMLKLGFLDEIESVYLERRIEQLEFDAMFWSHKTKSLKKTIDKLAKKRAPRRILDKAAQMELPFLNIPVLKIPFMPKPTSPRVHAC